MADHFYGMDFQKIAYLRNFTGFMARHKSEPVLYALSCFPAVLRSAPLLDSLVFPHVCYLSTLGQWLFWACAGVIAIAELVRSKKASCGQGQELVSAASDAEVSLDLMLPFIQ